MTKLRWWFIRLLMTRRERALVANAVAEYTDDPENEFAFDPLAQDEERMADQIIEVIAK